MGSKLISAKGICKAFGDNEVLKGIDLEVHEGKVLSIIGPSGSGKSTMLRIMTGLETADAGDIELKGSTSAWCSKALTCFRIIPYWEI